MTEDAKAEQRRARVLVQRGLALYARGELLAAASEWEMVLDLDPTADDARRYLDYLNENFDLLEERFKLAEEGGEAVELSLPYVLSAALEDSRAQAADKALPTLEFASLSQALLQETGVRAVTVPYPAVDEDGWPLGEGAPSLGLGMGLVDEEVPDEESGAPLRLPDEELAAPVPAELPAAPMSPELPPGLASAELAPPFEEDIGAVFADEDEEFVLGSLEREPSDVDAAGDDDHDGDHTGGELSLEQEGRARPTRDMHAVRTEEIPSAASPLRSRAGRPERLGLLEEEETVDMGTMSPSQLLWPSRMDRAGWPPAEGSEEPGSDEAGDVAVDMEGAVLDELDQLGSFGDLDDFDPVPTTSPPGKPPASLFIEELPSSPEQAPDAVPEPVRDTGSGSLSAAFRRAALVELGGAPATQRPRAHDTVEGLPPPPLPALAGPRRPVAQQDGAPSLDEMVRELIAEAEAQPIAASGADGQRSEERMRRFIDLAIVAHGRGELARAVVAVEVAINSDPDSAITQMLIQRHHDTLCAIYLDYLGDLEAVPAMAVELREIGAHQLDSRAMFLLSRLDGVMCISEVLDIAGMPEHEALHYLASMRLRGVIKL